MFLDVLPRHNNLIVDSGLNIFPDCAARCVYLSPEEEECTYSCWGEGKMNLSGSIANSRRMLNEINKNGAIVSVRMSM